MNPKSNGCMSVLKKKKNKKQNYNYNYNDITRLLGLKIIIDPDYLSSNDDACSLKNGHKIGTTLSNHHLKSCDLHHLLPHRMIWINILI